LIAKYCTNLIWQSDTLEATLTCVRIRCQCAGSQ
jgi:hypothetical protein